MNLVYTIAFDRQGSCSHQLMAKMLASSLLRTHFSDEVVVFHNAPLPLFKVERAGVGEVFVERAAGLTGWAGKALGQGFKYRARHHLDTSGCDKVMFVDCDCIAMRNLDHLLAGDDWDILWQPEEGNTFGGENGHFFNAYLTEEEMMSLAKRTPANSGTWAVRAEHYQAVMEQWEELDAVEPLRKKRGGDQLAWNRLLLDTPLRKKKFERGEIGFPSMPWNSWHDYKDAALLHFAGGLAEEKLPFLAGMYYSKFFADPSGLLLDILEP